MKNRKKTTEFILKYIDKLTTGDENLKMYTEVLEGLSNAEFDKFMEQLGDGSQHLTIISANYSKTTNLNLERNLKIAKELGHDFFQPLVKGPVGDTPGYTSPVKNMVLHTPFRRTSQLLVKKIGVAKHNKSIDQLTGQPVGDSKGSRLSFPELQILASLGLEDSLTELLKYRGGDRRGYAAMTTLLNRYGNVDQKTLERYSGGVESTKTLKSFLTAMHLKNTL